MAIIHLTFDFPDCIVESKTKAVENLVASQRVYDNVVFSMNRTINIFKCFNPIKTDDGYAMHIFGFPFGIGLRIWMYFAYRNMLKIIIRENIQVELIHAHKLTFEGLIAYFLSKEINKPYLVTVRGDTDLNVIKRKPECRFFFKKVIQCSQSIIFLAPWTEGIFKNYFQDAKYSSQLIPNIVKLYEFNIDVNTDRNNSFISVLRLDSYKRKNIKRIIEAIDYLHQKYPLISLDIVGTGSTRSTKEIRKYIYKCKFPGRFRLLGYIEHDRVLHMYGNYMGLILPSKPETFGLVFIEALNAGLPIVYAKNSGIDGFFDNCSIGHKVDWGSEQQIIEAIEKIYNSNQIYLKAVNSYVKSGGLEVFSKERVSRSYLFSISKVIQK